MLNVIMAAVIVASPVSAPPRVLAVCHSITQVMLCKPMDTLSLPPEPTIGDARVEAQRRYKQLPWVCDLNIAGRVEIETCVFPTHPDETPLRVILSR